MYAEVVVTVPIRPSVARGATAGRRKGGSSAPPPWEATFHYAVPPQLAARIAVGQLVVVPLGAVERQGVVVCLSDSSPVAETRDILSISDPEPALSLPQIRLARWISRNYFAPLSAAVELMLPPGIVRRLQPRFEPGRPVLPADELSPAERTLLARLHEKGSLTPAAVERVLGRREARPVLDRLVRQGYVAKRYHLGGSRVRPKVDRLIRLTASKNEIDSAVLSLGRPSRQADVLRVLVECGDPLPSRTWVMEQAGCTQGPLQTLARRGLVCCTPSAQWIRTTGRAAEEAALPKRQASLRERVADVLRGHPAGLEAGDLCRLARCRPGDLRALEAHGLIEIVKQNAALSLAVPPVEAVAEIVRLRGAGKHQAVLELLQKVGGTAWIGQVYAETGANLGTLRDLQDRGLIAIEEAEVLRDPLRGRMYRKQVAPELMPEQSHVWRLLEAALESRRGSRFLLHGVTGSGKTEIYLRAVEKVLEQGRGAIVLVPEIALTPQTIERFASRFPGLVAVQHSGLSDGERYDQWRQIRARRFPVVVGTRSALFAPVPHLGLIVLDEEHETTYKQGDVEPRYHARETAAELAGLTEATLILGSATPDVVSYARARQGYYTLLELPHRLIQADAGPRQARNSEAVTAKGAAVGKAGVSGSGAGALSTGLPDVQVVDMRRELSAGNRSIFSRALSEAIRQALERNEQVLVFLNRRGSATFVMCRDCGTALRCSRCDTSLTYHAGEGTLLCHHCNRRAAVPRTCPRCGSGRIRYFVVGTEKVAALQAEAFPRARLLRWDRDVTQTRGAHESIMQQFVRREADILIGTQMIAKGLDLPMVTVVGVLSADTALHFPDFRSSERTFQLLTQVAGRAGRSERGGRVIVQTYAPEHYAVQAASRHDYAAFYRAEMAFRRQHRYPPYARLVRFVYSHTSEAECRRQAGAFSQALHGRASQLGVAVDLIGPAPCFVGRLQGKHRWHLVLRMREPLEFLEGLRVPPGWQIDVDPVDLL